MHQNLIVVSSWSMGFFKKKSFFIFFSRFISKYIYLVKNDKHCCFFFFFFYSPAGPAAAAAAEEEVAAGTIASPKHCFKVIKKNHVLEKQNLVKSISSSRFVLFVFF